ncbi:VanZ family protein [Demequina sp. NBRC 110056]|uniref:VanZ family protein n=1 Tax=Demequina sp. NBRC 110056 TaxID=1570345 RepID=UPI000A041245|nr:VanZ family protein [Demequina sp. NBRC 110056]
MGVYQLDAVLAVAFTVMLLPVALTPTLGILVRRHGRVRAVPLLVVAGLLGSACSLAAFTVFPLPEPETLECSGRALEDYWQLDPSASLVDAGRALASSGPLAGPVLQVVLNVALFMPFGFFALLASQWSWARVTLASAAMSLLIEVTQGTGVYGLYPCPYRLFDTSDLIVNTAGGALGAALAALAMRRWPRAIDPPRDVEERPGTLRRTLAVAFDLLFVLVATTAVQLVVTLARAGAVGIETAVDELGSGWFPAVVALATATMLTLGIPLLRGDRATLGQWLLAVAPARTGMPASRARLTVRFLVRWAAFAASLPALGFLVMAADAVVAMIRRDRGTLTGLASGTTTATTLAPGEPADSAS